jgi:structure-specific recognition protein 1
MLMASSTAAAVDTLSFDNISHAPKPSPATTTTTTNVNISEGRFKMASGGVGWKAAATGQVVTVKSDLIKRAKWFRGYYNGYTLSLVVGGDTNGTDCIMAFYGFPAEARDQIDSFLSSNAAAYNNLQIETLTLDKRGWNHGSVIVDDDCLQFVPSSGSTSISASSTSADDIPSIMVPLQCIADAKVTGRAELSVELRDDPMVTEIRFHVPGKTLVVDSDSDSQGESQENAEKKLEKELLSEQVDAASALCEQIKAAAGLQEVVSSTIFTIGNVSCLVPRGRFDVDFGQTAVRFKGKSHEHRVNYQNVVQVEPALRHGQTRYPFLLLSMPKDELIEVEAVNYELAREKSVSLKQEGLTFEVLSGLFRQLAGQKIITPMSLPGQSGALPCIRCTNKANEGHLYFLERALLYLPKPTLLLQYQDISSVAFVRSGSGGMINTRSFDISILMKSGGADLQLSGLPKETLSVLHDLLKIKNVPVVDEGESAQKASSKKRPSAMADEDEDMPGGMRSNEDDGSSTDEEYDDKEGSDSSVDEEYDSEAEYDEEDEEDEVSEEEDDDEEEEEEGETD